MNLVNVNTVMCIHEHNRVWVRSDLDVLCMVTATRQDVRATTGLLAPRNWPTRAVHAPPRPEASCQISHGMVTDSIQVRSSVDELHTLRRLNTNIETLLVRCKNNSRIILKVHSRCSICV